jgi:hypothetical protein
MSFPLQRQLVDLLSFVIPDPQSCLDAAEKLRAGHGGDPPERLAHHVVVQARRWAAAAGGATGAAASPLVMIPAALADMGAVLRIEGNMAGTIGALLDPISLNQPEVFQADVLAIVFPGAVSQALRAIGVRAGQQFTRNLIRKYLTEGLLRSASEFAAKRLFIHVSERAVVSKTVPLVGAGIGAGWNWLELHAVGRRAIGYYQDRAMPGGLGKSYGIRRIVRMLPWHKRDEGGE